jgi:hypothetical protein
MVVCMSANIYWEPVNINTKCLNTPAPSYFIDSLERADMGLPNTFTNKDIPTLRGLAASIQDDRNPYTELITAIIEYGSVNVWYEH